MTGSFQRYLRAKRTVDDRALDRRLVGALREALAARAAERDGALRVLEIGAGIGTMLTRFLAWDVLPAGDTRYVALDVQADNVSALREYLSAWAADHDVSIAGEERLTLDDGTRRVTVEPVVAEAIDYADAAAPEYDLLVGAALLDVVDRDALGTLLGAVAPGGLYYFPITFDGATRFRPGHPADRDVERRYHEHMDAKPGGDSRAGGDVLDRLHRLDGTTLLDVAGSDWVVRPVDGAYPGDEAYFLRHILDTVEGAVGEVADGDAEWLDDWLARRREQVAAGELLYLTHQLDFLGRVEG
ncbi:hypothetical protein NDI56_13840 [Haloarcula sp. S1CR25-12]|uniref:Class I SAM-dependent methyltransferase n=1 Tax=Haloarcula saliterrae TaxID=2950534 RepID=A0ABU2FE33_9EURY|nr:hypothetical protein [Haloarcula sp. S1CR25-12]MDS0260482.1 hypothetical protein [Haloarcula sp. S1CR25-12]